MDEKNYENSYKQNTKKEEQCICFFDQLLFDFVQYDLFDPYLNYRWDQLVLICVDCFHRIKNNLNNNTKNQSEKHIQKNTHQNSKYFNILFNDEIVFIQSLKYEEMKNKLMMCEEMLEIDFPIPFQILIEVASPYPGGKNELVWKPIIDQFVNQYGWIHKLLSIEFDTETIEFFKNVRCFRFMTLLIIQYEKLFSYDRLTQWATLAIKIQDIEFIKYIIEAFDLGMTQILSSVSNSSQFLFIVDFLFRKTAKFEKRTLLENVIRNDNLEFFKYLITHHKTSIIEKMIDEALMKTRKPLKIKRFWESPKDNQ